MKRTLLAVGCVTLFALGACGDSSTKAPAVQKRVQDTSTKAAGPSGPAETMKMQEGVAPKKP